METPWEYYQEVPKLLEDMRAVAAGLVENAYQLELSKTYREDFKWFHAQHTALEKAYRDSLIRIAPEGEKKEGPDEGGEKLEDQLGEFLGGKDDEVQA